MILLHNTPLYLFVFLTLPSSYRNGANVRNSIPDRPSIYRTHLRLLYYQNNNNNKKGYARLSCLEGSYPSSDWRNTRHGGRYDEEALMRYYLTFFSFSFIKSDNWLYSHICWTVYVNVLNLFFHAFFRLRIEKSFFILTIDYIYTI